MNIAVLGIKGIPATYSGPEVHVEQLASRLVQRGHKVTVYCRKYYIEGKVLTGLCNSLYRGIRLKTLPTVRTKHLDAISHTLISSLNSLGEDYDIVHYQALGPSTLSFIPRMFNKKVVVTIHGLDWQRAKWRGLAKKYLKFGEYTSIEFANCTIVVSKTLKKYFEKKYKRKVFYIPNGVDINEPLPPKAITELFGLYGKDYLLFLARLVPEKGCHYLIQAFRSIKTDKKLVITGGAVYTEDYESKLKSLASKDTRIIFTGFQYGDITRELFSNAYAYILPSDIEGLPISLLEAMSYGCPVLASDIPENIEIISDEKETNEPNFGFYFMKSNVKDLQSKIEYILKHPKEIKEIAKRAKHHVSQIYSWKTITDRTESLYRYVLSGKVE